MADAKVVRKLIEAGVRNLQEFGYPSADEQNILTDQIYAAFFDRMLEDSLGKGHDAEIVAIREKLRSAIQ